MVLTQQSDAESALDPSGQWRHRITAPSALRPPIGTQCASRACDRAQTARSEKAEWIGTHRDECFCSRSIHHFRRGSSKILSLKRRWRRPWYD